MGFTDEVAEYLKIDIIERNSLVFITSSPNGHEKSDYYLNINKSWFDLIGISFNDYYLLDNRITKNIANEYISNSSCIFLMGGTTREQIAYIEENNFIPTLRKHRGIIIGVSAGAINLAEKSLHINNFKEPETIIYNGIGLTNKTVYPHFRIDDNEKINEIKKYSENFAIYGICDYSAIIEKGNETKMIGEIYKIENNNIERVN
jgi:peptidase E